MPFPVSPRALLREFVCDVVIFLYKVGEALLDATVRPYIVSAVCRDLYDNRPAPPALQHGSWFSWDSGDPQVGVLPAVPGPGAGGGVWHHHNTTVCERLGQFVEVEAEVQRHAAGIVVAHRILVNLPAVVLGLFCGAWSDRKGRKLPMMAPSAGSCLAVVLYLASTQVSHVKVALVLAGAFTQGIFGKASVIAMAVNSHVSDTSDREQRTRRLGRVLASSFLGMFLGSLLAGVLQDASSLYTTLSVVSACHALCVLTVLLGVPETVSDELDDGLDFVKKGVIAEDEEGEEEEEGQGGGGGGRHGSGKTAAVGPPGLFSLAGLKSSVVTVGRKREGNKRSVIIITLLALTMNQCLKVGDQDVTVLFVQDPPLAWTSSMYGYLIAADYGIMGLTLIFILPLLSDVLSVSDIAIAMIAIFFKLVRSTWAGFCTETWMMFVSVVSGALGALINPGLRAVLSKTANPGEVGKLFSIQASLETLSKLVGSSVFTGIYAATVRDLPAAAYLSEAALYVGVLVLLLWLGQLVREDGVFGLLWTFSRPYHALAKAGPAALPAIRTEDADKKPRESTSPIFPLGASTP
ncbi:proton-coupled folate transporter-like [Babylonia areolata]|uniref:proton-coupled folate transporter-like n=1 Tax=Babylonia areolata TaxID=304850 RepID=UPI003FD36FB8